MPECHHYDGGRCVLCRDGTNSCCGEDKNCSRCGSECCRDCWVKFPDFCKEGDFCVVCSGDLITDSALLHYALGKLKTDKETLKAEIQNKSKEKRGFQCAACESEQEDNELLLCDSCDRGYHFACLDFDREGFDLEQDWICEICEAIISAENSSSESD